MDENKSHELVFGDRRIAITILSHLLRGTEKCLYGTMRRLYRLFGKAREYRLFLMVARTLFFEEMFRRYKVATIGQLLQKKTGVDPHVVPAYRQFYENLERPCICFFTLDWTSRYMVRYLALYHGYMYIFCSKILYECDGPAYWNIHGAQHYRDRALTYRFLRQHSIHNLAYYELVEDAPRLIDRKYRLRRGLNVRGIGNTLEIHDVQCIQI